MENWELEDILKRARFVYKNGMRQRFNANEIIPIVDDLQNCKAVIAHMKEEKSRLLRDNDCLRRQIEMNGPRIR